MKVIAEGRKSHPAHPICQRRKQAPRITGTVPRSNEDRNPVRYEVSPVHGMKAYEWGGRAPHILNLSSG